MSRPLPRSLVVLALAACNPGIDEGDDPVGSTGWPAPVTETDQSACYSDQDEIACPAEGDAFYGQDGSYVRFPASYTDNDDGTVTDDVTGLVWQWEQVDKVAYDEAASYCGSLDLAGRDWRVPTIDESYSLIHFDGATGSGSFEQVPADALPYIDDEVFDFAYGDTAVGERFIDVQFITTSIYVGTAFSDADGLEPGEECFFGTNLADGRIKCYPTDPRQTWQLRCVSGAEGYGENDLEDGGDGTITDHATGLMWLAEDSGHFGAGDLGDGTMDWGDALAWCEGLDHAGHDDWRLPDTKELQSIVDYDRSPDTTGSAAIDPLFSTTVITDEAGDPNHGWYWTSTTHLDGMVPEANAAYIAFGEALGYTQGFTTQQMLVLDVHGAGAQRSDPKTGSRGDYPQMGMGPQGDVRRVFNLARCVRSLDG